MNRQRTDEKNENIEEVEKLKRSIVTGLSNNAKKTVEKELKNIFNSSSSRSKTKDNSIFKSIKIILAIIAIIFVINYIFNEYTIQIQKRNLNENNKENIKTNEIENNIGNTNIANDGISDEIKNASIIAEEKANNVSNVNSEKEVSKINNANISVNGENKENGKTVQGIIPNGKVESKVLRVVDGDTLKIQIADKDYKVRLLGVDTPESVSPKKEKNTKEGKIASEYTKKNLEGKDIILEFDVSPYDRYGRLLAYVYVDGICYNEKLLEEGYAKVMMISPNVKNSKYYRQIEKQAKENNAGFWNGFFK